MENEQLKLRCWKENDYIDYYEIVSESDVCYSAGCKAIESLEQCKKEIVYKIKCNSSFAIELKDTKKVIGFIGMDDIIIDKNNENATQKYIGFMINKKYWNNGYGTEIVRIFLKYLFHELNVDLVWTSHYDFNYKSAKVIKKNRFKYKFSKDVNTKKFNKENIKELFYLITKEEYDYNNI